jgi:hypothetical protein
VTPELAQTLGLAAALGFDPSRLLRADPIERPLLEAALEHAARFARERDEALAAQIVNRVVDAWNRGQRKAR